MRPIIAITGNTKIENAVTYNHINYTYVYSVLNGGGMPVILPVLRQDTDIDEYIDRFDGIIFSGGVDSSPLMYGENPFREVDAIDFKRDALEKKLFLKALEKKMPMLAICRGMQLANIALGGTLYQDVYKQVADVKGHTSYNDVSEGYHMISLEKDSILEKVFKKDRISVNSQHHQAIKTLADGFKVTARSDDDLIEAMEWQGDTYLHCVQFHPEAMSRRHPEFLGIFEDFVKYAIL